MESTELRRLFARYMEGSLTLEESDQLSEAAQTHSLNDWQEALIPLIENIAVTESYNEEEWKTFIENILQQSAKPAAKVIAIKRWRRIAAAVAIILVVGTGAYFSISVLNKKPKTEIVQTQEQRFKNDVQPGKNGAILTLDNGQQIILDSAHNGTLAEQGNSKIVKQGDQLTYNQQRATNKVVYNTIATTRGKQYPNLILADGSKVWLDAASSIRFPTSFTGNDRTVEITGQVWFDVEHNDKMPFKVIAKGVEINDLGTEFNVNSYDDEGAIKTTLIAGSVKVVTNGKNITIQPGQQAIFQNNNLSVNKNVNVDEVMAWKNGYFNFGGSDFEMIARQLSRWYDVEVVYDRKIDDLFYAEIPRNTMLSDVLKALELTGKVHFRIEGRRIIVMP